MIFHLYALVPLIAALILLVFGRMFIDWPMTFLGVCFLVWGVAIHARHLAIYRKMLRREGWIR